MTDQPMPSVGDDIQTLWGEARVLSVARADRGDYLAVELRPTIDKLVDGLNATIRRQEGDIDSLNREIECLKERLRQATREPELKPLTGVHRIYEATGQHRPAVFGDLYLDGPGVSEWKCKDKPSMLPQSIYRIRHDREFGQPRQ